MRKGARIAFGVSAIILTSVILLGGYLWVNVSSSADLIPLGRAAPDFTANTSDNKKMRLSDMRGKKRVVLVFYPGDNTPVCTAQLCSFRDHWEALQSENTVVYGVNPATSEAHHAFAEKNRLPFPLLVDVKGEIARQYGCNAPFGLVKRTVYIVDREGRVVWAQRGNPATDEVLKALHTLKDTP